MIVQLGGAYTGDFSPGTIARNLSFSILAAIVPGQKSGKYGEHLEQIPRTFVHQYGAATRMKPTLIPWSNTFVSFIENLHYNDEQTDLTDNAETNQIFTEIQLWLEYCHPNKSCPFPSVYNDSSR